MVLFVLAPNGNYQVLHKFAGGADGKLPNDVLVDTQGNVFGSTSGEGLCSDRKGCGTIFEYVASTRSYKVIYTFQGGVNGGGPMLGAIAADGTLYGAVNGGLHNHGALFALSPSGGGFTFSLLASFKYDGVNRDAPADPPTLAANGDLIGETYGRIYGYHAGKISTIFTFTAQTNMAGGPLLLGPHAMIYGAGEQGGQIPCTLIDGEQQFNGCGSVFSYPITP